VGFADLDSALVTQCQRGAVGAFEALCTAVGADLHRYICSVLRDHDDADDVYQEVLIRIHRHLPSLKEVGKFPGWAKRIAVNQCHTHRSRAARKSMSSWDALEDPPPIEQTVWDPNGAETPSQAILRQEMGATIGRAIAALPPRQRTCVTLFEVEGNSIREISTLLGCSEGAVKFNLHQARKRLQESLKGYLISGLAPRAAVAPRGGG
jgi:RNA polymerase sigma-70 factor (ECF subfamily)